MIANKERFVKIITVALSAFICLLMISLIVNLAKLSSLNKQSAQQAQMLEQLKTIERENGDTIKYMQSDEYVERYAREYLNMADSDDEIFIVE